MYGRTDGRTDGHPDPKIGPQVYLGPIKNSTNGKNNTFGWPKYIPEVILPRFCGVVCIETWFQFLFQAQQVLFSYHHQSSCLESLRGESGLIITCSPPAPSHCLYYLPAMVMTTTTPPLMTNVHYKLHCSFFI